MDNLGFYVLSRSGIVRVKGWFVKKQWYCVDKVKNECLAHKLTLSASPSSE